MSKVGRSRARRSPPLEPFFSAQVVEARRFFLSAGGAASGRPLVIGGGCERVDRTYVIDRPGVPFVGFEFVAAGAGTVLIGGREVPLSPGTVFTYGPGIAHRIMTDPGRPLVKYFVDARVVPARRVLVSAGVVVGDAWQTARPADLLRLLDELLLAGQSRTGFAQAVCDRLFEAVVLKSADARVPVGAAAARSFAVYQRCRRLMDEGPGRPRSLDGIAGECGVTAAYVCRLFRRYDRVTPYRHLLRVRMDHAAARLRRSDRLVKDVAAELGFADAFHFSKVFKRTFGLSPVEFRRLG